MDLVAGEVEDLQGAQHREGAAPQRRQLVVLQVELAQAAHGGERPHLHALDAVVGQV